MRLVFAAAKSVRALGARRPERGRGRRRGRGGLPARLRRCLARRGPADPQRHPTSRATSSPPRSRSRATRRCAACCPALARGAAGTAATQIGRALPGRAADRGRADRLPEAAARDPDLRAGRRSAPPSSCGASTRRLSPSRSRESSPRRRCSRRERRPSRSATSPTRRSPSTSGCGYRFYVERVLGAREPLAAGPATRRRRAGRARATSCAEPEVPRRLALGIGNAVHAALEWSARRGWRRPPDELIERLLAARGARRRPTPRRRARRRAGRRLARLRALRAELGERRRAAARGAVRARARARRWSAGRSTCSPSPPTALPTVSTTRPTRSRGRDAGRARRALRAQREVYALAAAAAIAARASLPRLPRGPRPTRSRRSIEADEVDGVRARLERIVERMRAGEFEPDRRALRGALLTAARRRRACARSPKWRPQALSRLAVFGYASLVSPASAAQTLGRPVERRSPPACGGWTPRLVARPRQPDARRRPSPAPTAPSPPTASGSTSSRRPLGRARTGP